LSKLRDGQHKVQKTLIVGDGECRRSNKINIRMTRSGLGKKDDAFLTRVRTDEDR